MPFDDKLSIYYTDEGQGPPVVFLHGLTLDHRLWYRQAPLAEEFRLVTYDARGSGASAAPDTGYDYPQLTQELLALMDRLQLEEAHMVGHSRGGGVLMRMALEYPHRVSSLTFVSSILRGFPWSDEFISLMRQGRKTSREEGVQRAVEEVWLPSDIFRCARENPAPVLDDLEEMIRAWSGAEWLDEGEYPPQEETDMERLGEVSPPALVLSGQEDLHDFVEIANMLAWWIPGATQKSFLGVGHFPMLENAHETNLYLRGFLRKASGMD